MTSQPDPIKNDSKPIALMVIEDMEKRMEVGLATYGTYLQAFNGRDPLQDLYEELLDACHYVKQVIVERDAQKRFKVVNAKGEVVFDMEVEVEENKEM